MAQLVGIVAAIVSIISVSTIAAVVIGNYIRVDRLIRLAQDRRRDASVQGQEARKAQLLEEVSHLTQQETELKARLEQMSKEDIVGQLIAQERRHEEERKVDARRDILLFVLGVLATVVLTLIGVLITIAMHYLGLT